MAAGSTPAPTRRRVAASPPAPRTRTAAAGGSPAARDPPPAQPAAQPPAPRDAHGAARRRAAVDAQRQRPARRSEPLTRTPGTTTTPRSDSRGRSDRCRRAARRRSDPVQAPARARSRGSRASRRPRSPSARRGPPARPRARAPRTRPAARPSRARRSARAGSGSARLARDEAQQLSAAAAARVGADRRVPDARARDPPRPGDQRRDVRRHLGRRAQVLLPLQDQRRHRGIGAADRARRPAGIRPAQAEVDLVRVRDLGVERRERGRRAAPARGRAPREAIGQRRAARPWQRRLLAHRGVAGGGEVARVDGTA